MKQMNENYNPQSKEEVHTLMANKGTRFVNWILDRVISNAFFFFVLAPLQAKIFYPQDPLDEIGPISLVIYLILYYAFFEIVFQKTPSKFFTRTKVVMEDGSKPNFLKITKRTFLRFLLAEFTEKSFEGKPTWIHDRLSKTRVIKI
jgi:uncharacterized RDD family membrane protein YckC